MLRVPIEQLRSGMVLARSIPHPEKPRHLLLKADYELDLECINRLRELRVYSVWIRYPNLDFLDELLDPELTRRQQELYDTLKLQFSKNQPMSLAKLNYNDYVNHISGLFKRMLTSEGKACMLINELHGQDNDVFQHGTTVAYLALLIGMRLENYIVQERPYISSRLAIDLTPLGVGCLLHDIGKLSLPEEIRNFRLTAQDHGDLAWQKHIEAGYEMVKGGLDPTSAKVVLDHHQHFDGSGFPPRKAIPGLPDQLEPLKGKEIHIFCRIATVADRFEGFRHLPDGRVAPTVVALKRMRNPGYVKWFDPLVFDVLVESIPPFAPGDQVILNNGQTVVVTEVNEHNPYRPVVKPIDLSVASDSNKQDAVKTEQKDEIDIDLSFRNDLSISQVGDFDVTDFLN